jgi:hypothetical protein
MITKDTTLKHNWCVWYHAEKDNWKISGYKMIYTIKTISDFWKFYNNWALVGGVCSKHWFLMKQGVTPTWEDITNVNGGCWSYKITEDQAEELFEDLSSYLVCESLADETVGLSVCMKKNNNCVIKIWNTNSKNNSLKLISNDILKKWGTDVIYIAHIPEQ